jgi:protein dithiol:quinone oxidoreductase
VEVGGDERQITSTPMINLPNRRISNLLGFAACGGLIGYAFYAQYVLLLEPCPLCWLQRVAFFILGVVFLLAALHNPKSWGARIYSVLVAIAALIGLGVAAKHIWVQAQPPGSLSSCGASVEYLLDIMPVFDVLKKIMIGSAECQHIDSLLGLSWPWWTVITMALLGAWGIVMNGRRR